MTAGALKRACHHVCKQPRSAPLNPQTGLYGVSSRMGGERRAGCQEGAGAGVAQSGGCHIRGQQMTRYSVIAPPGHSRQSTCHRTELVGPAPNTQSLPNVTVLAGDSDPQLAPRIPSSNGREGRRPWCVGRVVLRKA